MDPILATRSLPQTDRSGPVLDRRPLILRGSGGRRCKFGLDLSARDDLVHDPVLHGFLRREDVVTVGVLRDLLDRPLVRVAIDASARIQRR